MSCWLQYLANWPVEYLKTTLSSNSFFFRHYSRNYQTSFHHCSWASRSDVCFICVTGSILGYASDTIFSSQVSRLPVKRLAHHISGVEITRKGVCYELAKSIHGFPSTIEYWPSSSLFDVGFVSPLQQRKVCLLTDGTTTHTTCSAFCFI